MLSNKFVYEDRHNGEIHTFNRREACDIIFNIFNIEPSFADDAEIQKMLYYIFEIPYHFDNMEFIIIDNKIYQKLYACKDVRDEKLIYYCRHIVQQDNFLTIIHTNTDEEDEFIYNSNYHDFVNAILSIM